MQSNTVFSFQKHVFFLLLKLQPLWGWIPSALYDRVKCALFVFDVTFQFALKKTSTFGISTDYKFGDQELKTNLLFGPFFLTLQALTRKLIFFLFQFSFRFRIQPNSIKLGLTSKVFKCACKPSQPGRYSVLFWKYHEKSLCWSKCNYC